METCARKIIFEEEKMRKKIISGLLILCCLLPVVVFQVWGWAASLPEIRITGAVRQPLRLTMDDLIRFQSVSVRLNEVSEDTRYHGAFHYTGVPLRTLLEIAGIEKKGVTFNKLTDIVIVVRDRAGGLAVLSWGEVFYRNPAEIVLATAASPIMPHRQCSACHQAGAYEEYLEQLKRPVGFPKLVVAGDFYTDRSLEGVVSIEVLDVRPVTERRKMPRLFSPSFTLTGAVKKTLMVNNLSSYSRTDVLTKSVGEGIGYHGIKRFSGVPLTTLLENAGMEKGSNALCLVSAPDGYRSVVSFGIPGT